MPYKKIDYLLPLEQNSKLTEVHKVLNSFGLHNMRYRGEYLDCAASVYFVLNDINARFPEIDLPFCVIFDTVCDYVQQYADYLSEKYNKEVGKWS